MNNDFFNEDVAVFAAGCFWGVQYYFDQVPGVIETVVGYTGGRVDNPTYEQVCNTDTGHAEAIFIKYNPNIIDYEKLLRHFFRIHNPTQLDRQGPDIGRQYRSAIFYQDDNQKEVALRLINELKNDYDKPIVTRVAVGRDFWRAEDYHQKFTSRTGQGMCHTPFKEI